MATHPQVPARLASEDVIISAPMSYAGSAQRIFRLRRRAHTQQALVTVTALVVVLVIAVWVLVTAWYLAWGILLVPYRLLRRGARKRKAEMMRHRELLDAIQGSSAVPAAQPLRPATERVADSDREHAIEELRQHMLVGRLSAADFETRVGSVHDAVTRGDLASALADLPREAGSAST
jgi:Flp pilus assembly protein TadB